MESYDGPAVRLEVVSSRIRLVLQAEHRQGTWQGDRPATRRRLLVLLEAG